VKFIHPVMLLCLVVVIIAKHLDMHFIVFVFCFIGLYCCSAYILERVKEERKHDRQTQ